MNEAVKSFVVEGLVWIQVTIPYYANLSKNRATTLVKGKPVIKRGVKKALGQLGMLFRAEYNRRGRPPLLEPHVLLVELRYPPSRRGQKPDAANFVQYAQDVIAKELGLDDSTFDTRSWREDWTEAELVYTFMAGGATNE